ncbi:glycosyltransferase [bacterium]|nr:glycosyltransferase [bacterium]
MRFLFINTDYSPFLRSLYGINQQLANESYQKQLEAREDTLFGTADFYSKNLRRIGHEAWDIHANNFDLQNAWFREFSQGTKPERKKPLSSLRRFLQERIQPFRQSRQAWVYEILAAQIKFYRPDVVVNLDVRFISTPFLKQMKPQIRLLVAQHAATLLPDTQDFSCYDLAVSSFPPTVEFFKRKGLPAYSWPMAFETSILPEIQNTEQTSTVTFVGNFFKGVHDSRRELIEFLCKTFDVMEVWGPSIEQFPQNSSIRKHYKGEAWGRKLYEILSRSKITVNHHGDIPPFANNMRLYEATGVGTMLITDWKENLVDLFEPQKEVVTYRNFEECAEFIKYYLDHSSERESIARAGQLRTLHDHTYFQRMKEFVKIVSKHL